MLQSSAVPAAQHPGETTALATVSLSETREAQRYVLRSVGAGVDGPLLTAATVMPGNAGGMNASKALLTGPRGPSSTPPPIAALVLTGQLRRVNAGGQLVVGLDEEARAVDQLLELYAQRKQTKKIADRMRNECVRGRLLNLL